MDIFVRLDITTEGDNELTVAIRLQMRMSAVSQGEQYRRWGGSCPGKLANIFRDFTGLHRRSTLDYF